MDVANVPSLTAPPPYEADRMCADPRRPRRRVVGRPSPHRQSLDRARRPSVELRGADREGTTDRAALPGLLRDAACLIVQNPNFYGCVEDLDGLARDAHDAGALAVASVNPVALGLLRTPGEAGCDIAVGEGQALGGGLNFGGPYLGLMACRAKLLRRMPGRIVGQTTDREGRRGFVLTLQAREQHIRREKAGSNICSNEALNALTAAVYLSAMGPRGLRDAAGQCLQKAHYLAGALTRIPGVRLAWDAPFFHEFTTRHDRPVSPLLEALEKVGILGGLPLDERTVLWCVTEMNTREQMDRLLAVAGEVCA